MDRWFFSGWIIAAILPGICAVLTVVQCWKTLYTYPLDKASMRIDGGCGYIVPLPIRPVGWPLLTFGSDSEDLPTHSKLTLFEDGQEIGAPHVLHEDIRQKGGGRYSHWNSALLFSTPRCDSPRDNTNRYSIRIPAQASHTSFILWQVIAAIGFVQLLATGIRRLRWGSKAMSILRLLCGAADLESRSKLGWSLFLLMLLCVGMFLWISWTGHTTYSLSLGGLYQISDASGYWSCAVGLLDGGEFGGPLSPIRQWCQRRVIYPGMLASLIWMGRGNLVSVLLMQAALVVSGMYFFMRQCSLFVGLPSLLLIAALLLNFGAENVFTLAMTENAGLLFGCLSMFAILRGAMMRSLFWMALGICMLSIGLNARAGAFFVLPALVLASGVIAPRFKSKVFTWIVVAGCAASIGFLIQGVCVRLTGGNVGGSHASFAYTLYGLSAGGRGWTQVFVDHPELMGADSELARSIYNLAFKNIRERPADFIQGLYGSLTMLLSRGTYGYHRLGSFADLIRLFWWLGWIPMLRNIRSPSMMVLLFATCGILASAPFLLADGGPRVFAATIPIDVFQIGLGLNWLLSITFRIACFLGRNSPIILDGIRQDCVKELGFRSISLPILAVLLILAPYLFRLPSAPLVSPSVARPCGPRDAAVVAYLGGKYSLMMNFAAEQDVFAPFRGEVNHEKLVRGLIPNAWFNDDVVGLNSGAVITAFQLDKSDPYWPGPYHAVFSKPVSPENIGRLAMLCLDRDAEIKYASHSCRPVVSYSILD
jgi:hypothetical protein